MYHSRSLFRMSLVVAIALIAGLVLSVGLTPTTAEAAPAQNGYGDYHRVHKGESLSVIARKYSVTVKQLAHANGLSSTSYVYVGQKLHIPAAYGAPAGCAWYHYVKKGQTLSHIAKYLGVDYHALARANHISNPNHIYYGQKLCVPNIYGGGYKAKHAPNHDYGHQAKYDGGHGKYDGGHGKYDGGHGKYVVRHGDTLSQIAKYHGVSLYQLAHANGIHNKNHVYVGQHLYIPSY